MSYPVKVDAMIFSQKDFIRLSRIALEYGGLMLQKIALANMSREDQIEIDEYIRKNITPEFVSQVSDLATEERIRFSQFTEQNLGNLGNDELPGTIDPSVAVEEREGQTSQKRNELEQQYEQRWAYLSSLLSPVPGDIFPENNEVNPKSGFFTSRLFQEVSLHMQKADRDIQQTAVQRILRMVMSKVVQVKETDIPEVPSDNTAVIEQDQDDRISNAVVVTHNPNTATMNLFTNHPVGIQIMQGVSNTYNDDGTSLNRALSYYLGAPIEDNATDSRLAFFLRNPEALKHHVRYMDIINAINAVSKGEDVIATLRSNPNGNRKFRAAVLSAMKPFSHELDHQNPQVDPNIVNSNQSQNLLEIFYVMVQNELDNIGSGRKNKSESWLMKAVSGLTSRFVKSGKRESQGMWDIQGPPQDDAGRTMEVDPTKTKDKTDLALAMSIAHQISVFEGNILRKTSNMEVMIKSMAIQFEKLALSSQKGMRDVISEFQRLPEMERIPKNISELQNKYRNLFENFIAKTLYADKLRILAQTIGDRGKEQIESINQLRPKLEKDEFGGNDKSPKKMKKAYDKAIAEIAARLDMSKLVDAKHYNPQAIDYGKLKFAVKEAQRALFEKLLSQTSPQEAIKRLTPEAIKQELAHKNIAVEDLDFIKAAMSQVVSGDNYNQNTDMQVLQAQGLYDSALFEDQSEVAQQFMISVQSAGRKADETFINPTHRARTHATELLLGSAGMPILRAMSQYPEEVRKDFLDVIRTHKDAREAGKKMNAINEAYTEDISQLREMGEDVPYGRHRMTQPEIYWLFRSEPMPSHVFDVVKEKYEAANMRWHNDLTKHKIEEQKKGLHPTEMPLKPGHVDDKELTRFNEFWSEPGKIASPEDKLEHMASLVVSVYESALNKIGKLQSIRENLNKVASSSSITNIDRAIEEVLQDAEKRIEAISAAVDRIGTDRDGIGISSGAAA